ncbi:cytosine permease [Rhodococcus opacus]|nr:cytosine permease [Rhodococcus opacus]
MPANNAMTAYSSGLALQSVGLRLRRSRSVLLDGSMGVAMTLYALLVSNFLDTVSNMMQLVVTVMGPVMAVYVADVLWRRNRYDGIELGNETSSSPYWYSGGINWAGTAAVFTGIAAAALCVAAPVYTGPIANAVGGVDLSLPVGLIVSAALYVVLMRSYRTRWATLATVLLEPEHRRARILAGTPIDARRRSWTTLDATEPAYVVGG